MLDELHDLQVFYINIGGGEPMIRRDFFELVEYSIAQRHRREVLDQRRVHRRRRRPGASPAMDYLDIQISLDGIDAATNDAVRGDGSLRHGPPGDGPPGRAPASGRSRSPSSSPATTSTSSTGSRRWPTPTAPSCGSPACARRAAAPTPGTSCTRPTPSSARSTDWLLAHGDDVLTGDSFFHLNALGEPLPGLNMCGAGRVVCLIDPIGDVYACPFVHPRRVQGRLGARRRRLRRGVAAQRAVPRAARAAVGRRLRQLRQLRRVPGRLHGGQVLHRPAARRPRPRVRQRPRRGRAGGSRTSRSRPKPSMDHSKPVTVTMRRHAVGTIPVAGTDATYVIRQRRRARPARPSPTSSARSRAPSWWRASKGIDITAVGSGNPGASNVTRVLGSRRGVLVFVLDGLKGAIAGRAGLLFDSRPTAYLLAAALP